MVTGAPRGEEKEQNKSRSTFYLSLLSATGWISFGKMQFVALSLSENHHSALELMDTRLGGNPLQLDSRIPSIENKNKPQPGSKSACLVGINRVCRGAVES